MNSSYRGVCIAAYGGAAVMGEQELSVNHFIYTSVIITLYLSIVGLDYGYVDLVAFPYHLKNPAGYASGLVAGNEIRILQI